MISNSSENIIIKDAKRYSHSRKFKYKKITPELFRIEVMLARALGELSGAERLLQSIVQNKDWTREDIEAEIHIFIKDVNNTVAAHFKGSRAVDLENVLIAHGYIEPNDKVE